LRAVYNHGTDWQLKNKMGMNKLSITRAMQTGIGLASSLKISYQNRA
jgi:hypothetical protein